MCVDSNRATTQRDESRVPGGTLSVACVCSIDGVTKRIYYCRRLCSSVRYQLQLLLEYDALHDNAQTRRECTTRFQGGDDFVICVLLIAFHCTSLLSNVL